MRTNVRSGWGRRCALVPIAVLLALVGAGCASQFEMIDVWRDPTFTSGPVRNVLVVGLRKDPVRRRLWEDAFTRELKLRGVDAAPSYQIFREAPPDTQDVIEAVRKNGYGAVLSSVRLPDEEHSTFVAGTFSRQPVTVQDYLGRFHTYWREVQDPGHVETDDVRLVQTDIWTTSDGGRLIWSGTLRTLESVNGKAVDKAVTREIMPELARQGLVPGKRE